VRKNLRIENRAKRFVKRGLAEWVEPGGLIRVIPDPRDHRDAASPAKEATRPASAYAIALTLQLARFVEVAVSGCHLVASAMTTDEIRRH
jgi:hypothetical protein